MQYKIILKLTILLFLNNIIEFLPVSSTAHGIFINKILNIGLNLKLILAFAQLGISLGVCFYFKNKIVNITNSLFKNTLKTIIFLLKIFITMIPTILVGFFCYKVIKNVVNSNRTIAICLLLGSILMLIAEKNYKNNKKHLKNIKNFEKIDFLTAFKIGLIQSLSLIPGISRSASTISAGLFCKLSRKISVDFSFFISIPISILASLYDIYKNVNYINNNFFVYFYCFVLSFIFSIVFCEKILNFLKNNKLYIFVWYRIILGIFIFFL